MPAPHPIARRIHDRVLQLLATALVKAETCEKLAELGRHDEVSSNLEDLRSALEQMGVELQGIMGDLRELPPVDESLKNRAA